MDVFWNNVRNWRSLCSFLIHQRVRGFDVPHAPHFDAESLAAFKELLRASNSYLEFGSGGSTMLASRCGTATLAVESDPFYARSVRRALGQTQTCRVLIADIGMTVEWGAPMFKRPTAERVRRWRRYVDAPFTDQIRKAHAFPDLVLVDGRFRVACALRTAKEANVRKVPVTICLDDYVDRQWYHGVEQFLGAPRMTGRMAIFACQPAQSGIALDNAIEQASKDWR